MAQMMVCPPSPLGYTQYERRYYAGDWWYRLSPEAPWKVCIKGGPDEAKPDEVEEEDETMEYMCELLEAREIHPEEFRRQMRNEGYNEEVISGCIRHRRPDYNSLVD